VAVFCRQAAASRGPAATLGITAPPMPIAIELKCVAVIDGSS